MKKTTITPAFITTDIVPLATTYGGEFGPFDDSSVIGMQNYDQQSMVDNIALFNNQEIPGTQEILEEPVYYDLQGGN